MSATWEGVCLTKKITFGRRLLTLFKPTNIGTISLWVGIGLLLSIVLVITFRSKPYTGDIPITPYFAYITLHHPLYSFLIFIISLIGVVLGIIGAIRNRGRVQAIIGLLINSLLCLISSERVFAYLLLSLMGRGGMP